LFNSGISRFKRHVGQLSLVLGLGIGVATQAAAQSSVMPPPPEIGAKGYMLLDLTTGQTLAEFNSRERLDPASLTKLMTAYMAFAALDSKQIRMDQQVPVSPYAWKAEGSRMFIEPNKPVTVEELLYGVIVQSGNDASRAIAELLAGDENNFATLMNQQAKRLGLTDTNFKNSTGLPDPQHYTTARDLGILAKRIITDFPEYYKKCIPPRNTPTTAFANPTATACFGLTPPWTA